MSLSPLEVVQAAVLAGNSAALARYAQDGFADAGYCGGAMLKLKGNSKIAKAALEAGAAYKSGSEVWVSFPMLPGISTQSAQVYQAQKRAFKDKLEELGFEKSISKWWCYVD